jgi:hypothetical protein
LREVLGAGLPVLYLQGASGDTSPWNMLASPPRYDGEQRVREMGHVLAGETLRLLRNLSYADDPGLSHAHEDLELKVRLPAPEQVRAAEKAEAAGEGSLDRWNYVLLVDGALRLYREFKNHPVDLVPVHVVRVGGLAIATNPCELYCQFGLNIRRRSPAEATMISQLTDGCPGYCPTTYGLIGGGYSSDPTYWCRLEAEAGYKLVDASAKLLRALWRK